MKNVDPIKSIIASLAFSMVSIECNIVSVHSIVHCTVYTTILHCSLKRNSVHLTVHCTFHCTL